VKLPLRRQRRHSSLQHVLMVLSYTEKMDEEAQFFRERFGDHNPEEFDLEETYEMLKEFDFEYKRGWDKSFLS
jgi:hypothetical protein